MIVTIDGGVASGKSAVGKRVAEKLGLPFIDSGLMYRAVTRLATQSGIDPHDSEAVTELAESTRMRIEGERVWADGIELTHGIYDTDYADALRQQGLEVLAGEINRCRQRRGCGSPTCGPHAPVRFVLPSPGSELPLWPVPAG